MSVSDRATAIRQELDDGELSELTGNTAPDVEDYKPADFSDAGNAQLFQSLYGDFTLYTKGAGWFVWNGRRWLGSDHAALKLAIHMSDNILTQALSEYSAAKKDDDAQKLAAAKAFLTHSERTRQKPRLEALLSLAEAGVYCPLSKLDPNANDLNTPAGIVDLTTGSIKPHDPKSCCTKITSTAPGNAGRQMWHDFLNVITSGDNSVEGFLQLVAGMALFGKVYHEGIVIGNGSGRNGKSTFFNALAAVLGDYAGHITVNTLTTERGNKGAALATMRGKRLILTGELEEHQRLSIATLKALASTDTVVAEEKFRQPEEFKPSHTICLFTNHLPRVGSTDNGTWRRLTVVPFDAVISTENAVQNYGDVLVQKAGGAILQWAIEGAVNFARNGFKLLVPDAIAIASEEYRAREDWLSNFISERCTKGDRVSGGELYAAYRAWSESSGEYVRRQSDFVTAMETSGYRKVTSNGRAYWIGVILERCQTLVSQGFHS